MNAMALRFGLVVVCMSLAVVACGEDGATPAVGVGCRLNSDCGVGLGCVEGACVERGCEGGDCPCTSERGGGGVQRG